MSADRKWIAEAEGVDPHRVYCKNCYFFKPWYINPICKFWDQTTTANAFCSFWRDKIMADKIVNFHEWCNKCKYRDLPEAEDPCHECLNNSVNEDSHQPTEFVEKSAPNMK